jgi:adenylate cyclase
MTRRLAAILAADVVGYSRLMGADETGTLQRLTELRQQVLEPLVADHHGRVVKLMGDGMLVEFASVVDAVTCAVAWQNDVAQREAVADKEKRLKFRIGINLGDVIAEEDDIHGDGVNIASRLEGLAEPGGICLSGDAYRQAKGKVQINFEDLGEHDLKNITEPIRVYQIVGNGTEPAPTKAPLALPDKPSIAVLPFTNMSGDPEQEYFSDGITEDIITELSRFKNLFVIARNSTFAFKGQAVDVGAVGAKLGVAYVVEGSVRKAGNRVRVTAQLVEAKSGNHIWAERYDRDLEDIFAVQDELVHEIAVAVPEQLNVAAVNRARRRNVENLSAYDYVLRGEWLLNQDYGSLEARGLFEKAIEIDPGCARAYTRLAAIHAYSVFSHGVSVNEAAELGRLNAERALEIDPTDPAIQAIVAEAYIMVGEHDLARRHIERAIKLNPNEYAVMNFAGIVLMYLGDHEKALTWLHRLSRHDPFFSDSIREHYFDLYYMTRRYEDAIGIYRGWRNPPPHMSLELAVTYAQLDRLDDMRAAMTQHEQTRPGGFDPQQVANAHARLCAREEDREHWLEGYRKIGIEV